MNDKVYSEGERSEIVYFVMNGLFQANKKLMIDDYMLEKD